DCEYACWDSRINRRFLDCRRLAHRQRLALDDERYRSTRLLRRPNRYLERQPVDRLPAPADVLDRPLQDVLCRDEVELPVGIDETLPITLTLLFVWRRAHQFLLEVE